jgi:hypothetical protein
MNRFALVVGIFFAMLGIVNLSISSSHIPILAYPLMAIGLFLIVLSFLIPPHYLQSVNREKSGNAQSPEKLPEQPEAPQSVVAR